MHSGLGPRQWKPDRRPVDGHGYSTARDEGDRAQQVFEMLTPGPRDPRPRAPSEIVTAGCKQLELALDLVELADRGHGRRLARLVEAPLALLGQVARHMGEGNDREGTHGHERAQDEEQQQPAGHGAAK